VLKHKTKMSNKNNNKLTQRELQKFKELLLAKRNEILSNVISMEDEALHRQKSDLSNMPIHMADIGTDNYEIEYTLGLVDSERKLMREIDDALDRIENCTYGICEGSGKSIPKARLEAMPWARYCVEYARLLEKGLVREKDSFIESIFNDPSDEEQDKDSDEAAEYESD
jgi:RNA polymerase-binding protein DksA